MLVERGFDGFEREPNSYSGINNPAALFEFPRSIAFPHPFLHCGSEVSTTRSGEEEPGDRSPQMTGGKYNLPPWQTSLVTPFTLG